MTDPDEARIGRGVAAALVAGLFASGAASLVFEVVIARRLATMLGSGAWSRGIVLSTFLLGLAIGSALGGRWADRLGARALWGWAGLEVAVAAGIGLSPTISDALGTWLAAATRTMSAGVGLDAIRLVVAAAVVLVPAIAMGMSLPMIVRGIADRRPASSTMPVLYAANTAGAATGVAVAAVWWVPSFGIDGALWLAAITEGFVAAVACGVAVRVGRRARGGGELTPTTRSLGFIAEGAVLGPGWSLVVAGLIGTVSLALQVLWTRWFGIVFGSSSASFAIVLTVFLVGLAIGGTVVALAAARPLQLRRGLAFALVAASGWLTISLVVSERLPWWQQQVLVGLDADPAAWPWLLVWQVLIAAVWMLPVTSAVGATLPAMVVLRSPDAEDSGRQVGRLIAVNTLGTVVAPMIVLFVVMPGLGLQASLRVAVVALAFVGVLVGGGAGRRCRHALVGTALVIVALAAAVPSWRPGVVHAGTFRRPFGTPPGSWTTFVDRYDYTTLMVYDGPEDSVFVGETPAGVRFLKVNGKADASLGDDVLTQRYLAHLPLAIHAASTAPHGHPRRVFVLGVGSGQTAAAATMHGPVDVTAVDISAGVLRALPWFVDDTADDERIAAVDLRRGDARFELQRDPGFWDVIISEPSNPWVAGNAALFSRDFFVDVQRRLQPDGVFAQWMHLYATDAEVLALVIDTVRSVFDDVTVWLVGPVDIVLVARSASYPLAHDRLRDVIEAIDGPFAAEPGAITSLPRFLALQLASDADLDARPMGPVHTDTRPRLQAVAPRALFVGGLPDELVALDRRRDPDATSLELAREPLTDADLADLLAFVADRDTPLIPHLAASIAWVAAERRVEPLLASQVLADRGVGGPDEVAMALGRVAANPSLDACTFASSGVAARLAARSSAWVQPDRSRFDSVMRLCAATHPDERDRFAPAAAWRP